VEGRFGFDPTNVFDPVAGQYRTARPGYPDGLYDALEQLVGSLQSKAVIDLGAGTGIATSGLAGRGAQVIAVDPSLGMLGNFLLPAACGRAEAIPVRSASQELVTCAQAWHWVDTASALPECRRVLKDGGHLALWWNVSGSGAGWIRDVEAAGGLGAYGVGEHQDDPGTLTRNGLFGAVSYREVAWHWTVPTDTWMQAAATRSTLAHLGDRARDRLRAIRAVLDSYFPDGVVTEAFSTHLAVATAV
jgi:SAM-dependent methyltransferase